MAVTKFEGGWSLAAAADTASATQTTRNIRVDTVVIVKTTAGTVTLKDGDGVVCLLTGNLGDGSTTVIDLDGAVMSGLELDAISAGSAVVYVYGRDH